MYNWKSIQNYYDEHTMMDTRKTFNINSNK